MRGACLPGLAPNGEAELSSPSGEREKGDGGAGPPIGLCGPPAWYRNSLLGLHAGRRRAVGEEELHRALRATGLTSEQLAGAEGGGVGPGRRKETQFQQQPLLLPRPSSEWLEVMKLYSL